MRAASAMIVGPSELLWLGLCVVGGSIGVTGGSIGAEGSTIGLELIHMHTSHAHPGGKVPQTQRESESGFLRLWTRMWVIREEEPATILEQKPHELSFSTAWLRTCV